MDINEMSFIHVIKSFSILKNPVQAAQLLIFIIHYLVFVSVYENIKMDIIKGKSKWKKSIS